MRSALQHLLPRRAAAVLCVVMLAALCSVSFAPAASAHGAGGDDAPASNHRSGAAAAEWIAPSAPGGEGAEPWVFLVAGDGTVAERWDNVTNSTQLSAALDQLG